VIKINPSFAPGYDALAIFYSQRGTNLTEARDLIERAVQLGPGVPEIRIDQSQVLASMNKTREAIEVLELAVKMSHTPEQVAAVENVLENLRKYDAARSKLRAENKAAVPTRIDTAPAGGASKGTPPVETPPTPFYSPEVEYTDAAKAAKFEGTCVVVVTVGIDGKPSNVVVTKKIGMGMDERAVATVSRWKFDPGRRYGKPVVSRLRLTLTFKLYGNDSQKFIDLSQKARTGDPAAEFELANAFFAGRDIPRDEAQGMALLERSARSGYAQAQFQMGERTYGDGNAAENYVAAYVWYTQAQRTGSDQAERKVTELESRLTPDQLVEARKRLEGAPAPK
jgi:TonB family protein